MIPKRIQLSTFVHFILLWQTEVGQKSVVEQSRFAITLLHFVPLAKNETRVWPAESKTPAVQEISPESLPGNENSVFRNCGIFFPNILAKIKFIFVLLNLQLKEVMGKQEYNVAELVTMSGRCQ